ncbi:MULTISPECIES: hypothetical protein [Aerococcus]|uniref:Lipoprotein n=1 Tax=Aerococcus sanguinicola TaxID=119206 RepID=A0A5N1GLJ3_9LACT|nr:MULTISPECIES: hypothetical protein [Aerococcus]KAA9301264.1 hypothetical protein F6I03_05185 [Aerococcus sanguinicola]MDK6369199.1 hypothetical protein [Aerococcus sp. UMB9870]MDK6679023.1 hypothetical protein [Aerococcus sp. UMB8608]MDK6687428.1 hypothetical protein [Aerococcus sp. UMB8623]OFK16249.1 hypothetical protein HMPREF2829_04650 [Aerococcus sp. HMSC072A12]
MKMSKFASKLLLASSVFLLAACSQDSAQNNEAGTVSQADTTSQAGEAVADSQADSKQSQDGQDEASSEDASDASGAEDASSDQAADASADEAKDGEGVTVQGSAQGDDYPYGVSAENVGAIRFVIPHTVANAPQNINLDNNEGYVNIPGQGNFAMQIKQVPTKTIQVFSAQLPGQIRDIKVNTVVEVDNDQADFPKEWYLYYNEQGGISLAAPNFAGNTTADQANTMQEYLN